MSPLSEKIRLSYYYGAYFAVVGVMAPFWPLWLNHKGLDASDIGLILTFTAWARMSVNPLIAQTADRYNLERRILRILAVAGALTCSLYFFADRFWSLLLLSLLFGVFLNAILPIGEKQVLGRVYARGFDYGRLRLWGSLTFILTGLIAGSVIDGPVGPPGVLYLVIGCLGFVIIAVTLLPDTLRPTSEDRSSALLALLKNRTFLIFVAAGAMIQASHGAYYGFSAIHWKANGMSGETIAWLWAVGVIAEIGLFAFSATLLARFNIIGLLAIGAIAASVRWGITAITVDPMILFLAQPLHALTFGATHLGAMHFIARAVPDSAGASAQSLYAALGSGIATASALWFSGQIYDTAQGYTFIFMCGYAGLGILATFWLARRWRGEKLQLGSHS